MTLPYPDRAAGRRALERLRAVDPHWSTATVAAWLGVPQHEATSARHADRLQRLAQRAEWHHQSAGAHCPGATPPEAS